MKNKISVLNSNQNSVERGKIDRSKSCTWPLTFLMQARQTKECRTPTPSHSEITYRAPTSPHSEVTYRAPISPHSEMRRSCMNTNMVFGICLVIFELVSEWMLFNANWTIFQLFHGENDFIFNELMMRSTLYQTNTLSWIFIVLAHWNNSPRIDMLPQFRYIISILSQPVFPLSP